MGSYPSTFIPLERWIETGIAQLKNIQNKYEPGSFEHRLGDFYLAVWPKVVKLFWEGRA